MRRLLWAFAFCATSVSANPKSTSENLTVNIGVGDEFIASFLRSDIGKDFTSDGLEKFLTSLEQQAYEKLGVHVQIEVQDPIKLAAQLSAGTLDFALIPGESYASTKAVTTTIEPLVYGTNADDFSPAVHSNLVVRKTSLGASLQGMRLSYGPGRTYDTYFLKSLMASFGPGGENLFPFETEKRDNMEDMLDDLLDRGDGDQPYSDVAAVDDQALAQYARRKPARFARLAVLKRSPDYPAPMLVYDPYHLRRPVEDLVESYIKPGPMRWSFSDQPIGMAAGRYFGASNFSLITSAYAALLPEGAGLEPVTDFTRSTASSNHYVMFVSLNGHPDVPMKSHTVAIFLEDNGGKPTYKTISWLPDDGYIHPLSVQVGRNYTWEQTYAFGTGGDWQFFGPYLLKDDVYKKALDRLAFLEPQNVLYKMFDWKTNRPGNTDQRGGADNCVHAVAGVVGAFDQGSTWGVDATKAVVDFYARQGALVDYPTTYPEISRRAGLTN